MKEILKKHSIMKIRFCLPAFSCLAGLIASCSNAQTNSYSKNDRVEAEVFSITQAVEHVEPVEFYLEIGSRFWPISKSEMVNFTEVKDFIGEEEFNRQTRVEATSLVAVENEKQTDIRYSGDSEKLTDEQMEVLRNAEYGQHYCLKTFFEPRSAKEEAEGCNIYNPHFTVAPETGASYPLGEEMIYDYLKAMIKDELDGVSEKDLSPGMFNFIINADGYLQSVEQNGSCGIKALDGRLKEAISNLPAKWVPAQNSKGEHVSQELVLYYGLRGC